jgi:hypothetical protein
LDLKVERSGWRNFTFCFHDNEEVGPAALAKIAKGTGLRPEDLRAAADRLCVFCDAFCWA